MCTYVGVLKSGHRAPRRGRRGAMLVDDTDSGAGRGAVRGAAGRKLNTLNEH